MTTRLLRTASRYAALVGAMAVLGCGTTDDSESLSTTEQSLSGAWYASWGGTMNSAGTAYTSGAASKIELGVNINDTNAVSVFPDGSGNWWLQARAAANRTASAAAVCFPATNAWFWEPTPGGFPAGSQYFSGIMAVGAVTGNPAQITVSDQGTNPDIHPLHFGTWTLTTSNVNRGEVWPGYWSWSQDYTSYSYWHAVGGSFTETLPSGTSCFLTSIDGNLQLNSFSNGAWASVNYSTGVWTFTAASGTSAWWLCLD